MKLPILELKGIGSINNNKKHLFKLKRIKTIANFFLLQKHNISSIFSENKLKSEILTCYIYIVEYLFILFYFGFSFLLNLL